jgi:Fuc2NAc and GlcNAc transferase
VQALALAATAAGAAAVAWIAGLLVVALAPRLGLVQVPNARSSHTVPTPTGGGIALVAASVPVAVLAPASGAVLAAWGLAVGLALVGLWDDRARLGVPVRLAAQGLAALILVAGLGLVDTGSFSRVAIGLALVLAIVAWVNAYNFMDGIDALACVEAAFIALTGLGLALWAHPAAIFAELWWLTGLAGAALGFLVLNRPPARVFMGDTGSYFVGFMLAALALISGMRGVLPGWAWLILAGVFVADAAVTLAVRGVTGEAWTHAHRSHAYQRLAQRWGSHGPVVGAVLAVNVVWLLPLAAASVAWPSLGALFAATALLPLGVAAWALGAGHAAS